MKKRKLFYVYKYYRIIKNKIVKFLFVDNFLKSSIIRLCAFVIMHKECSVQWKGRWI